MLKDKRPKKGRWIDDPAAFSMLQGQTAA